MEEVYNFLGIESEILIKIIESAIIIFLLIMVRIILGYVLRKRIKDVKKFYYYRNVTQYALGILSILLVGPVWIRGIGSITTFLGLASAGIAIALHDTIANIAGWFYLIYRRPFRVGNRIEIDGITGDVIDVGLFQFSLIEVGNWVDADQSTGRIIHIPNNKVLKDPIANYDMSFEYIWHEIPVLITFESDWKKVKELLLKIVMAKAEHLSDGAQEQIRRAARKYMIFYKNLTPIVYTTVKSSGVLLTIRYIVKSRQRRSTEQLIWETILEEFSKDKDAQLAYNTTRFYTSEES